MRNQKVRRSVVGGVSLLVLVVMVATLAAADRPNIILLMGDDHGWDETGYNEIGRAHV